MVGLSSKKERPSFTIASYLKEQGFRIIPVNPTVAEILGERSYPDLFSIPDRVDVVNIFCRSEDVLPIVEEAIKIRAKSMWMQEEDCKRGHSYPHPGSRTPGGHEQMHA